MQLAKTILIGQNSGNKILFYTENNYIFSKSINFENIAQVADDYYDDLSVLIDKNNIIHLIYQSIDGNIIYSYFNNDAWIRDIILESKFKTAYKKYITIKSIDDHIHFFYVIKNDSVHLLVHQSNENISEPVVIDRIIAKDTPYLINVDLNNMFFIFYMKQNKSIELGFKKLSEYAGTWSSFTKIDCEYEEFSLIDCICDKKCIIHLLCSVNENEKYKLICFNKASESIQPFKSSVIQTFFNNIENVHISCIDSNLWIVWTENNDIFTSCSINNGRNWTNPFRYQFSKPSNLLRIQYSSCSISENNHLSVNCFLGTLIPSFRFVVISELCNMSLYTDEETAAAAEVEMLPYNISVYLENIRGCFYDIAQKITVSENEKSKLYGSLSDLSDKNGYMTSQITALRKSINNYEHEVDKLTLENTELKNNIKDISQQLDKKEIGISNQTPTLSQTSFIKHSKIDCKSSWLQKFMNYFKDKIQQ